MMGRNAPAAPEMVEKSESEQITALGLALLARSEECVRLCEQRLSATGMDVVGTPEFQVRRRATQLIGVQLFARWLETGEIASVEERNYLGGLGELAAQTGVSIHKMTRGYFQFRDVVKELLDEEAARLGSAPDVLDRVHQMNLFSCDNSVLWMTRNFDRQKELQAAEETRLHAELSASEARFRSVYESMTCGVVVVGADGVVLSSNDAAAVMLEFPKERLVGFNVFKIKGYRDEEGISLEQVPTAEALATRRAIWGRVVKHDFGDGRPVRWHQVDAVPIFDADGELVQVISTFVDVTAVRAAEELRAESAAKSRFLATMSHELRTPLNSILGFAQLLRMNGSGQLDATQKRYVSNIETSGAHLLALISDILELSKVAAGQVVISVEDVELEPAIQQVADEFEPLFAGMPIDLELDLASGLVARVDGLRFRQVVVNLVANALKFTEAGTVKISTRKRGAQVELRVADTGIGIPSDQMDRVFDEFTQVDSSTTRSHGGTGLGLPLTRRLVELMDGSFTLDSTVGRGTTAIVVLPLAN
jgi:PAS domain S-box-containing protein